MCVTRENPRTIFKLDSSNQGIYSTNKRHNLKSICFKNINPCSRYKGSPIMIYPAK